MFVLWSWRVILFVFSCGTMCNINTVGCQICFIIYACLCVYTCLCLCMLWPSHPSKHLIQCFQPLAEVSVFSPLFSVVFSLFPHWSVALPFSPFTPPQVAIMSDTIIMSQLRALMHTDPEKTPVLERGKQSLLSPIVHFHSCSLSHLLSQQVDGSEVSPCDSTALCLSHGGSDFSSND